MIKIDGIGIDEEVIKAEFLCDLEKCKGACCTFYGDYGAPLLESEILKIRDNLTVILENLPGRSKKIIEKEDFFEGAPGNYTTNCIDKRDCVFVYYEGDIAKCGIEKAYFDGKIDLRKPLSCHLFPVRVGNDEGLYIYYEKIEECWPAILKGNAGKVRLVEMLEDALVRAFGREWYDELKELKP